ncbi:hypothetical protein Tco_0910149 [Tanacetum coccineum]|uniref:Uncharacterized protein n=1 Tax=Tanacetum coccineum TaxID=301880 RepID=A0ABQ5CZ83_9ASTR
MSVQSLQSNPSPPFLYTPSSAIDGVRVFVYCKPGKVIGVGLSGERLGSLKECTRRGWEELETMGRGGMVLAPRGIEYPVARRLSYWAFSSPISFEVDFVCTMAEIGCNWARIGPSKSSQSLSKMHTNGL